MDCKILEPMGMRTEWLIEKDKTGKVYKRAIGSNERIYKI